MNIDSEICRRARLARDPRFDGEFFVAVRTTGIYCRPICPARPPAEKNVQYFQNATQAAEGGFRPCLRCRPESAPNSPAWRGSSTTVQRALDLIRAGALNAGSLEALADRLGVGERYLRKLFQRELGVSPLAVAQNQRLLFAKKLLMETGMPMTEVAFASGFGSVRRFNSAVLASFGFTPGDLRRHSRADSSCADIELQLHYRPPYDWAGVINFFARHAIEGVEQVDADSYQRNILVDGKPGLIRVQPIAGRNALQLLLRLPAPGELMPIVARVRRMFDLDANPTVVREALQSDPVLGQLIDDIPGIRSPIQWSVYEATVRAIVGQQVSIQAARSVCARLVAACNEGSGASVFPQPGAIAELDDSHFPMPGRRRDTLREFCRRSAALENPLDLETFSSLRGIGPWTTAMVAMRGHGDPDIFPTGDLVLVKAYEALSISLTSSPDLKHTIENWRPWRSYAANLLWRSLST
ncbi:MAG: DNA-3-methyladenine glycosylase 2 family protein [Proteobacteria bacterium]|nr:DNA-3-methyladenine glycosylase 2 family protein [Pseudomonadota bacterium]